MIQAVISDFGGVLTSPLIEGFLAYERESGVSPKQLGEAMARIQETHGQHPLFALERGEISERQFWRRLSSELPQAQRLERLREVYFSHIEPNRAMIDFMRELRGRGLRMALCTNNVREWEPLWRAKLPELDEIFEVVVDSAFVGTRKPESDIFHMTLDRLGDPPPPECVFVDDLEVNCEAAQRLGMCAVRFESTEQAIAEMRELLDEGGG